MRSLIVFLLLCSVHLQAQPSGPSPKPKPKNLVINAGFETPTDTTKALNPDNPIAAAAGWSAPNKSGGKLITSVKQGDKYFVYDPYGTNWSFSARNGKNVAGIGICTGAPEYPARGYIQGTLREPLTVGKKYYFGFWVHYHCEGANNIGIVFLPDKMQLDSPGIIPFKPVSYQTHVTPYDHNRTWFAVRDSFIAYKPYQYFVIGNFFPDSMTEVQSDNIKHYFAFVDDIMVIEAENQTFRKELDEKEEAAKWAENVVVSQRSNVPLALKNVYFKFNTAVLLPESNQTLNELLEQMQAVPNLKIKIKGHTSTEGDEAYNLRLSNSRAKAVKTYLVEKGIAENRIKFEGYGEKIPVAPNDTEENRAHNRRVEFEIVDR